MLREETARVKGGASAKGGSRAKGDPSAKGEPSAFRRNVRILNGLVFLGFGVLASILLAPMLKTWWLILREPVVWVPAPPPLLPALGMASALAVALWVALSHLLSGRASPRWASIAVIVLTSVITFFGVVPGPSDTLQVSPGGRVGGAFDALVGAAARIHQEEGEYPADANALEAAVADRSTGFRRKGREVPFTVVVETGLGPRLQAREGDLPGTFYYTVAPNRRRYWMTALVLDGAPTGRLVFAEGSDGPVVVSRGPPG
jgi:hypothetical protein